MTYSWLEGEGSTLIYIGDPMCSWCYGFAPEISEIKEAYPQYDFKVILCCLRPGGTETNKDLGSFLDHHWKEVEKRTWQKFNYDILKDDSLVYDTEPSSRAVVVARKMKPEIELHFFKAVQLAFYFEGKDMRDVESFVEIAKKFDLDESQYRELFESEEIKYETKTDYQLSSEMGIKGFPSMVFKHAGQFFLISNGYREAKDLKETIESILKGE